LLSYESQALKSSQAKSPGQWNVMERMKIFRSSGGRRRDK